MSLLSTAGLHAAILVPNDFGATSGAGASLLPFHQNAQTFQLQISGNQLAGAVGQTITGISFRLNESTSPNTDQRDFTDYSITLAAAANPFGSISTTFSENMEDPSVVRTGPLTVPADAFTSGGDPNPFSYTIQFDAGYTYSGGDLVILFSHSGNGLANYAIDAADTSTTGYGNSPGAQFYAQSPNGDAPMPIIQLELAPVPEPAEYAAMAGIGLLAFAAWRKTRRQATA